MRWGYHSAKWHVMLIDWHLINELLIEGNSYCECFAAVEQSVIEPFASAKSVAMAVKGNGRHYNQVETAMVNGVTRRFLNAICPNT